MGDKRALVVWKKSRQIIRARTGPYVPPKFCPLSSASGCWILRSRLARPSSPRLRHPSGVTAMVMKQQNMKRWVVKRHIMCKVFPCGGMFTSSMKSYFHVWYHMAHKLSRNVGWCLRYVRIMPFEMPCRAIFMSSSCSHHVTCHVCIM